MFDQPYEVRLRLWREFREQLVGDPEPHWAVLRFFDSAPFTAELLADPWDRSTWPDPWELLAMNRFCDFSRALLIYYTLNIVDETVDVKIASLIDMDDSTTEFVVIYGSNVISFNKDIVPLSSLSSNTSLDIING